MAADLRIDLAIYPGSRVAKSTKTERYTVQAQMYPAVIGERIRCRDRGKLETGPRHGQAEVSSDLGRHTCALLAGWQAG